jgi:hypothetical protein
MLMRIISALADQDAYPVHLEVSGSRNRAYFEQCGFRTMETIDVCSEVSRASLCASQSLCRIQIGTLRLLVLPFPTTFQNQTRFPRRWATPCSCATTRDCHNVLSLIFPGSS